MNVSYEHIDNIHRSYHGISLDVEQCTAHLRGAVRDNLLDREERQGMLDTLRALHEETGFNVSEELLADIQALEDESMSLREFRIGEAYAEVILEEEFVCRFHWNENRDARNPKGNKTGADLVGFIEVEGQVLFLFGEVKTSSETAIRPPQVMTSNTGMESQLRDLYSDRTKRQILISYLQSKVRNLPEDHPFRIDYDASLRNYYCNVCPFQLIGVLVRDVEVDHRDISSSYERLSSYMLDPHGIKLLALYIPIRKEEWEAIINEPAE